MLFSNEKDVIPCGMYSLEHCILLLVTITCIIIALKHTKNMEKEKVKEIIRKSTIVLWILEAIKIVYSIYNYGFTSVNKYVPLYFCSLMLYAGILSGFCKGKLKKIGDVFLATGGIVAGIVYLVIPITSLTLYPAIHFITIYSFILHGTMVYVGLLMLITGYVTIKKDDIIYYSSMIVIISIIAYIVNMFCDSNLMFISKNYPGTFIELIYNHTGKLFTVFMVLSQATLPFYAVFGIYNIFNKNKEKTNKNIEQKNTGQENKKQEKEEIFN